MNVRPISRHALRIEAPVLTYRQRLHNVLNDGLVERRERASSVHLKRNGDRHDAELIACFSSDDAAGWTRCTDLWLPSDLKEASLEK